MSRGSQTPLLRASHRAHGSRLWAPALRRAAVSTTGLLGCKRERCVHAHGITHTYTQTNNQPNKQKTTNQTNTQTTTQINIRPTNQTSIRPTSQTNNQTTNQARCENSPAPRELRNPLTCFMLSISLVTVVDPAMDCLFLKVPMFLKNQQSEKRTREFPRCWWAFGECPAEIPVAVYDQGYWEPTLRRLFDCFFLSFLQIFAKGFN